MASTQADVQALVQLMRHMNVEPEELLAAARPQNLPTFEQFMPLVRDAAPPAAREVYKPYWNRIVASWGERRLDEPTPREVDELIEHVRAGALRRRNHTDGAGAVRHIHQALQRVYRTAMDEGILSPRQNPMARVPKPPIFKSRRHALSPRLHQEIVQAAVSTGRDPRLDGLLLRFHLETAARKGGALSLRLEDLDPDRSLVALTEKGSIQRLRPVSRTLMQALLDHAEERGVRGKESRLLRFRDGRPLTRVHQDNLWKRVAVKWAGVAALPAGRDISRPRCACGGLDRRALARLDPLIPMSPRRFCYGSQTFRRPGRAGRHSLRDAHRHRLEPAAYLPVRCLGLDLLAAIGYDHDEYRLRKWTRTAVGVAVTALASGAMTLTAALASTAAQDGVCDSGEFCDHST